MSARRFVWLLLAPLAVWSGCAPSPRAPSPIERAEVDALVQSFESRVASIEGLRGSGRGDLTTGGKSLPFAFAFVWSREGWLRADVRPELGSAGTGWTSLVLVRGDSARVYFPARGVEARGPISSRLGVWTQEQILPAALGLPDLGLLAALEGAATAVTEEDVSITGSLHGAELEVELGRDKKEGPSVRRVSLEWADGQRLNLRYGGHGWEEGSPLPRTVSIEFTAHGSKPLEVALEYRSVKSAADLSLDAYAFRAPPGVRIVGLADLGLWR